MKKFLAILVLGLLLISNIAEAKSKDIGNGLTINIPKKYKHFEINFKKLTSTFPGIKKMLDEDEIDKEEFESFGIVVAEALSCGCPVVVSNKTPWKDIEKNNCGILAENKKLSFYLHKWEDK